MAEKLHVSVFQEHIKFTTKKLLDGSRMWKILGFLPEVLCSLAAYGISPLFLRSNNVLTTGRRA